MIKTADIRLRMADEYLKEAELLQREKIGNLPVLANLYHAMMNCLFALFDIEGIGSLTHADVIDRYRKEFSEGGPFDGKVIDALDFAFQITHECNCEHMKPPGDKEMNKLFPVVKEFINNVRNFITDK